MKSHKSYHESLTKALKDPEEAIAYINAAIEEGDVEVFLLALRNLAEVRGMSNVAKSAKLHRVSLYRMLSKEGNPEFQSVLNLLNALGFKIAIQARRFKKAA